MKSFLSLLLTSALAALSLAGPVTNVRAPTDLPRLILYYQTTHNSRGEPISMLPLVTEKNIALTHLIVCSLHINRGGVIHLNDYPPSNPRFYTLWNETVVLRNSGAKIMGMVGGAAPGSFDKTTLDGDQATFDYYYGQLRDTILEYDLDGMDLDVEQAMSQAGIERLVARLYADFGQNFIITLAPVASAMRNGANLSGFNYKTLEAKHGGSIDFYNAQFYSGFGTMRAPSDFQRIVSAGWDPADIVAGQLTSPSNGNGYTPYDQLNSTITSLRDTYGQIGGVMGWEYFNSLPGNEQRPWEWAQIMTKILRPNRVPDLRVTVEDAVKLRKAYVDSTMAGGQFRAMGDIKPNVDYDAMVHV